MIFESLCKLRKKRLQLNVDRNSYISCSYQQKGSKQQGGAVGMWGESCN